ncbi:hypothetical protein DP939_23015 [Spongiactinospora rosea]|uniref:Deoxyribonuclease NucA/NucB domain-containing protein n=1 Tax=Spongiactinospora rosea TaxID=2248750 RepID=A0A366LX23_9ACTN|nr:hypothetical protein [Spongiactinospora rosea]RBQ17742.1 hypothetical protein DP939_23015 [Spongiactinospora rosea]
MHLRFRARAAGWIWSGTSPEVETGEYSEVEIPAGKLADGWKVRWRARATAEGVNGPWTNWHNLTIDVTKPILEGEYASPTSGNGGTATTLTPMFTGYIDDPAGRPGVMTVQVEHAPEVPGQGSGLIWSGTSPEVETGEYSEVEIPAGKLADGWKVRWRARATAEGVNGPWTNWHNLTIDLTESTTIPKDTAGSLQADPIAGPWPTWSNNRVTLADCWNNKIANSKKKFPYGWVRDSYNWCSVRTLGKVRVVKNQGSCGCETKVKGKIEFLFSVVGHTFAGGKKDSPQAEIDQNNGGINSRTMKIWARIDQIHVKGIDGSIAWPESSTITLHMPPATGDDMNCTLTRGGSRTSTLAEWRTSPQQYFEYISYKTPSAGPHKLSVCTFKPTLIAGYIPGQTSDPYINTKMSDISVRCDTSEDLKDRYGGCAFVEFTPTFTAPLIYAWKNGEPVINESADLIRRAIEEPANTYPKKHDEPKIIPGTPDKGPLHRSNSKDRETKNRNKSRTYCAQMLAEIKEPKPVDRDCDEFPFAATHEGSDGPVTNRNVAVDYIIWDHNVKVGAKLRWFWQDYRVFGSDPTNGTDRTNAFERFYVSTPH